MTKHATAGDAARNIRLTMSGHAAHVAFDDLCCKILRAEGYGSFVDEFLAGVAHWHDEAAPYPRRANEMNAGFPVSIHIPGAPVAKGRARATAIGGHARLYTPQKTVRFEQLVALAGRDAMAGAEPYAGPVALVVKAVIGVPASWSKKKTADALAGAIMPTSRPDLDNYIKAALDGLNEIVWKDDSQVVNLSSSKRYGTVLGLWITAVGA